VGIALARGKLASLSQTVAELLPEEVARVPSSPARDVTLAQILTGTSGLAYDNQRDFLALLRAKDPVQWVLALPADGRTPGTWSYNDAAVSLLAPILERAYGQPLAEIATQELFAPLGIEQFRAVRDGAGRVPTYHGLSLLPRDLLKVAWTMLDGGAWQGRQVVPPSWVAQSTQPAVDGSWPLGPIGRSRYAMLWFTGRLQGRPVTWAWGYGGQFAWLVPSLRLAVVSAATSPPPRELGQQTVAIANLLARVVGTAA
jgi:CubicO group peptidase (beta-lactamase class C family)